jgi:anaerobic selenocysteine-containing dehydrogenase
VALSIHRYLFEEGHADSAFLAEYTTGAERLRERALPWTFERAAAESGVDGGLLRAFAEAYATTTPALIRCGWGQERNRNGGGASMAILSLPAVAGKFGVRGGGYTMSNSASWNIPRNWVRSDEPPTRTINMNLLGQALEQSDPPIKVLFVYNNNAAATSPNQRKVIKGLERDDLFTVVFEQVMTDTARYADVILPATTFLEGYELARSYGSFSLRLAKPVIDAVGEARPNADVFGDLMAALDLGQEDEPRGELEEMLDVLSRLPESIGGDLRDSGVATPPYGGRPIQFVDVFPQTPDRKICLFCEDLDRNAPAGLYGYQPDPATPQFPLALITPASERTISSTLGELSRPEVRLEMNPDDADARGIEEGDAIRVWNGLGQMRINAHLSVLVKRGIVAMPKGVWRRNTKNGYTSNALTPDSLSDLGGGACFNDARVQVEKVTN